MAADGDRFQKRVSYGMGKVYNAICEGDAPERIAPLLLAALKNMLRDDLRTPALGPLITAAQAFFTEQLPELFVEGRIEQEARLRTNFEAIQRAYLYSESSAIAVRACEAAAVTLLDQPAVSFTKDQVADQCCARYYEALFDRFGFDPMQCDLMRKRGFSHAEMEQFRSEAIAIIKSQAVALLRHVAESKTGMPPRCKRGAAEAPIENTSSGLEEALVTLS